LNVLHLAELAGLLSVHALQIVESPSRDSVESFCLLGNVSQERSEAWQLRMESLTEVAHCWQSLYPGSYDPRGPLIEEILVSEIHTRVLAGLLTARSQHHGEKAACLMAAVLFNNHQAARRMALGEMLAMADAQNPAVRRLDRIRRLAERWTDILMGPLGCRFPIAPLVFDPERSQEYGQAMLPGLTSPAGSGLLAAGLRVAFPETLIGVPSHAGFHRDMAAACLSLLPEELFERDGGLLPLRTVRSLQKGPGREINPAGTLRRRKPSGQSSPESQGLANLPLSQLKRRQRKP
jgi:hypothetical protein